MLFTDLYFLFSTSNFRLFFLFSFVNSHRRKTRYGDGCAKPCIFVYMYIIMYLFVEPGELYLQNRNPHGTSTQASGQRASEMPMQRSMLGKFAREKVAESTAKASSMSGDARSSSTREYPLFLTREREGERECK